MGGPVACFFPHLSKTGGTTLRQIILGQYGADATLRVDMQDGRTVPDVLRALPTSTRAVIGHLPYVVRDAFPVPVEVVTLLRDPVDRVLSHFRYVRDDLAAPAHREVLELDLDLPGYVRHPRLGRLVANGQTRLLGGGLGDAEAGLPALATALRRIDNGLSVAGVTERFDESVLLMRHELGWDWPAYDRWKVSTSGPRRADLPAALEREILERNELDAELHRRATDRLRDRVTALGSAFQTEVRLLRILNRRREGVPG